MLHTCSKGRFNINLFIERFDDLKIYKKAKKKLNFIFGCETCGNPCVSWSLNVRVSSHCGVASHISGGVVATGLPLTMTDVLQNGEEESVAFKKLTTCSIPNLPRLQANTQIDWALVATKISSLSKTKWVKQYQSYSGKCRCSSPQKYCWNLMGAHKQLCRERLFKKKVVISIYLQHQSSLEQWHTQMLHVTGMFTKPCPLVHACGHMSPKSFR